MNLRLALAGLLVAGVVALPQAGYARGDGVASEVVRVDGIGIHVLRAGVGDPLVLVHGFVSSARDWRPVIPTLARDHAVVAYDRPGSGSSEDFPGHPGDYSVGSQARLLSELCAALHLGRIVCIGQAYGGSVCLKLAELSPDRVRALVLIGSTGVPFPLPLAWKLGRMVDWHWSDAVAGFVFRVPWVGRSMVRTRYRMAMGDPEHLHSTIVDEEYAALVRDGLHPLFEEIRQWRDQSVAAGLGRIEARTLVLVGRRDRYYMAPRWISQELARRIPKAQLVEPRSWGNMPQIEYPKQLGETINRFVDLSDGDSLPPAHGSAG